MSSTYAHDDDVWIGTFVEKLRERVAFKRLARGPSAISEDLRTLGRVFAAGGIGVIGLVAGLVLVGAML